MPAKNPLAATTAAEVEVRLPKSILVRRGDIQHAFGLSDEDMKAMIPSVFQPVPLNLPPNNRRKKAKSRTGRRAIFSRTQVIAVARQWEKQT